MSAHRRSFDSRVLVLEFDSVRQAERFAAAEDPRDVVTELMGMLRAALLISDRVLLTDSMILDGVFFAHMPPEVLAQALGVPVQDLPITVICSHDSLQASLRAKRRDRTYVWQLDDHLSANAKRRHFDTWVTTRSLVLEPYVALAPFRPFDDQWRAGLSRAAQRYLATAVHLTKRSEFVRLDARMRAAHPSDDDVAEVALWWHTSYLIAIAVSAHADWLRFDAPPPGSDGLARHARPGRRRLYVADEVTRLATRMTPAVFGQVRYLTEESRAAVHEKPTGLRMRNLTYAIKKPLEKHNRIGAIASAAMRLLIGAAAAAVALPFLGDLFPAAQVAWAAFAVVAVASTPWDAVRSLFDALRRHEAIMSIRAEEP